MIVKTAYAKLDDAYQELLVQHIELCNKNDLLRAALVQIWGLYPKASEAAKIADRALNRS